MRKEYKTSTRLKRGQEYTLSVELTDNSHEIEAYMGPDYYIGKTENQVITFIMDEIVPERTLMIEFEASEDIVSRIKLEKGSKATDWTSAPEDDKEYVDSQITISNNLIKTEIGNDMDTRFSEVSQTIDEFKVGVNDDIDGVRSELSVKAGEINSKIEGVDGRVASVSQNLDRYKVSVRDEFSGVRTSITSTASSIRSEVSSVDGRVSSVDRRVDSLTSVVSNKADSSEISQLSNRINAKVSSGDVVSEINISRDNIDLSSNRVLIGNEGVFTIENGVISSEWVDSGRPQGTYTVIKATGGVAFATSSPSRRSTTNAGLQIWHNGQLRWGNGQGLIWPGYTSGLVIESSEYIHLRPTATVEIDGRVIPRYNRQNNLGIIGNEWDNIVGRSFRMGGVGVLQPLDGTSTASVELYARNDLILKPSRLTRVVSDLRPYSNGNYHLGGANFRWDTAWTINGVSETSDERLKRDIRDIPEKLLSYMKELKPKEYIMGEHIQYGYIAQDVERVFFKYAVDEYGVDVARRNKELFNIVDRGESYLALLYSQVHALKQAENEKKFEEAKKELEEIKNRLEVLENEK